MPLINRCCCWDDLRSASQATAIYSLVFSLVCIFLFIYFLSFHGNVDDEDDIESIVYKVWFGMVFVYALVFIVSVILMVGVQNEQKGLLLPYLFYMIFYVFVDAGVNAFVYITTGPTSINVFNLAFCVIRVLLTIVCELCVFSLYQLLMANKGMKEDNGMLRECQVSTITLEDRLGLPQSRKDTNPKARTYDRAHAKRTRNKDHHAVPSTSEQSEMFDDLFRPKSALSATDVRMLTTTPPPKGGYGNPAMQHDFGSARSIRKGGEGQEEIELPMTSYDRSREKPRDVKGRPPRNLKQVNVDMHYEEYRL